jgi:hypothetical protein
VAVGVAVTRLCGQEYEESGKNVVFRKMLY